MQELMAIDQEDCDAIGNLSVMIDEELASTAKAIEDANQRIKKCSRENNAGMKLEINEQLLVSCGDLMCKLKDLIGCGKNVLVEIVTEEMVSEQ